MFCNRNNFMYSKEAELTPYDVDNDIDININSGMGASMPGMMGQSMAMSNEMMMTDGCGCNTGCNMGCASACDPIVERPVEKCVHRHFVHEVPHVCPVNTRIINHHVYRHSFAPRYTCCEENVVSQESCGSCCQFR